VYRNQIGSRCETNPHQRETRIADVPLDARWASSVVSLGSRCRDLAHQPAICFIGHIVVAVGW